MSAHPGSQCAKCGMDVHGEELCGWCEADVLRVALEEARRERDEARADAYEKVQALAAVSGILLGIDVPSTWDHYGAVADARKCVRERDEARALNHRGLMKLVENERLRDALEEIAGMCSENAEQMQAIAQDALGSMPPSNLPYICPKSVAVAEDLTPGEITYVEVKPDMAELRMALREACGDAPLLEGALDELAAYRAYVPSLPDLVAAATKGAKR